MTAARVLAAALATVAALLVAAAPARAELVSALSNNLVAITTGFTGASVLVFGATDGAGGDVVVVVRGPETEATVHRKARRLGIWLNTDAVDFEAVPGFWAVAATRPLAEILPAGVAELHQIGLASLHLQPQRRKTPAATAAEFRAALLADKERAGLYTARPAAILFLGNRLFRTDLWIPVNAPIGTYTVSVFLVRDGDVVSAETTPLVVGKVGFEARVYEFAHRLPIAYGVLAVAIAVMAGWLANVAFRRD